MEVNINYFKTQFKNKDSDRITKQNPAKKYAYII